jgi:hypothetical protein
LKMLNDAHKLTKTGAPADLEKMLLVMTNARKVVQHCRSKNPHKVIFMLISGRSEPWYMHNSRTLLTSLSKKVDAGTECDETHHSSLSANSGGTSSSSASSSSSSIGSSSSSNTEEDCGGGEWGIPNKVEVAKKYAKSQSFSEANIAAATVLVTHAMVNLKNSQYWGGDKGMRRALTDLRIRLAETTAAPPPMSRRALELLNEAHASNKALALCELEKVLLLMTDACKVIQHKLLFSLVSGRSELWFGKNARALLIKLTAAAAAASD